MSAANEFHTATLIDATACSTIRYDTIEEISVESKAEYTA